MIESTARQLGKVNVLSKRQIEKLLAQREKWGVRKDVGIKSTRQSKRKKKQRASYKHCGTPFVVVTMGLWAKEVCYALSLRGCRASLFFGLQEERPREFQRADL